jgi:hypothetical protein
MLEKGVYNVPINETDPRTFSHAEANKLLRAAGVVVTKHRAAASRMLTWASRTWRLAGAQPSAAVTHATADTEVLDGASMRSPAALVMARDSVRVSGAPIADTALVKSGSRGRLAERYGSPSNPAIRASRFPVR